MKQHCARAWEVEAVRDRRLTGDALRAAEQHRSRCASCTREHESLQSLAAMLRATRAVDEVALRRSRNVVLERASRPGEVNAPHPWRSYLGVGLVAALASTIAVWTPPPAPPPRPTAVVITASEGASFSRSSDGSVDRVHLVEGVLAFDVREHALGRRFVVAVPDGEIEDVGTRFRVATHQGRTEEIVVEEGAIVFRRPGLATVELRAGQAYRADAPPPIATTRATAASSAGSAPAPEAMPAPVACVKPRARSAPSIAVGSVPRATRPLDVTAAVPLLVAASAAPRSSAIAAEEQAEDDAYLRVVALLREGRREEAKVAARSYVARFPSGLRRREMDVVAE